MTLSHKDVEAIADILGKERADVDLVASFTYWLCNENPRFDSWKFAKRIINAREEVKEAVQ